jgi:hypothetical protein
MTDCGFALFIGVMLGGFAMLLGMWMGGRDE